MSLWSESEESALYVRCMEGGFMDGRKVWKGARFISVVRFLFVERGKRGFLDHFLSIVYSSTQLPKRSWELFGRFICVIHESSKGFSVVRGNLCNASDLVVGLFQVLAHLPIQTLI